MIAVSEKERLQQTYQAYENIKYHIAKKRRELGISRPTVAIGSGINLQTVRKIETDISEFNDVNLSSLISVCLFFKMSIQELFEMRPEIDTEETSAIAELLKKERVQASDLPEAQKNDFINYIGEDKHISSDILAAWYRIQTLTNKFVDRPKLSNLISGRIKKLEIGGTHHYQKELHLQFYEFIRTVPDKTFELRKISLPHESPVKFQCKRVR